MNPAAASFFSDADPVNRSHKGVNTLPESGEIPLVTSTMCCPPSGASVADSRVRPRRKRTRRLPDASSRPVAGDRLAPDAGGCAVHRLRIGAGCGQSPPDAWTCRRMAARQNAPGGQALVGNTAGGRRCRAGNLPCGRIDAGPRRRKHVGDRTVDARDARVAGGPEQAGAGVRGRAHGVRAPHIIVPVLHFGGKVASRRAQTRHGSPRTAQNREFLRRRSSTETARTAQRTRPLRSRPKRLRSIRAVLMFSGAAV